jgi:hypothetical protein
LLPPIEHQELAVPLRRSSNRPTAEPRNWRVEQLGGGFGNPVSLGLYRVNGQAGDSAGDFFWSLILKIAQSPANVGMGDLGGGEDVRHWNYWRREYHLYPSDLLDRLPRGLAAPQFYGAVVRPGDIYWLWLEEIADMYGGNWPVERHQLAARHLGRLSGVYLKDFSPADYPWLARSTLRQWLTGTHSIDPHLSSPERVSALMGHPAVNRLFDGESRELFRRCIVNRERLLDALDSLPQTLGHQDTYPTNLMARRDEHGLEETVALDWGMAGVAPIGSDLAQLFIGLCLNNTGLPAGAAEQLVIGGYLAGLRDTAWTGDEWAVRLGFTATTVLRLIFLVIFYLQGGSSPAAGTEPPTSEMLEELVANLNKVARLLVHLAPQVFQLLDPV